MAEKTDMFPGMKSWLGSAGGAVPFRRFMEAALYDPGFGYYSSQIRTVGARGDFSTTATLSPRLAEGLAAWVLEESARGTGLRHVIEIGPGSGVLHAAFRRALGWRGRWHWRSHLVERSAVLRGEQRKVVGGRGVEWQPSMEAALEACGGEALIFSNEVVDAFPVTLLQKHEGVWQEVWLELQPDGRVVEALWPVTWDPVGAEGLARPGLPDGRDGADGPHRRGRSDRSDRSDRPDSPQGKSGRDIQSPPSARHAPASTSSPADAHGPVRAVDTGLKAADFAGGQRIEVHESWRDWFRGWRPGWRRGTMLTIDYGDVGNAVYYRRPGGTVRGYEGHRRLEGLAVYRTPGRCDLTADVNFADLMRWGGEAGLRVDLLETQAEFFARQAAPRRNREVDAWLADASGAGGAFKFLWQTLSGPTD